MEARMNYGVVLPIWQLSIRDAETLALKAEELGLDAVFVPDHILAPPATTQHYGPNWPDPFSFLAFVAGRTRRIHVGASVIVLPYRHPLVTAKAAATVDQASGGRFIFGIGVGWDEEEFRNLGLPFRQRGAQTDEYIRVIKAAWAADQPSFSGKYHTFAGATFAPRPAQTPHPPMWVGGLPGTLSSPALRRVALLCDVWHPLALTLDDIEKGIGTIGEMARKAGRAQQIGCAPRNLLALTDQPKGSGRAAFEGSVDEVAADVRRARALGCEWMTFDLPRGEVAGMARAMERLAKEVRSAV
jgi:probable F420-dependent oxidoreductase